MNTGNWLTIAGLIITILIFIIPIVYYSGKIVSKLETVIQRLSGLEGQVTKFQGECFTRADANERMRTTDNERVAMWGQIDKCKKLARQALFRMGINPDDGEEKKL